jgi:hypothetical protein
MIQKILASTSLRISTVAAAALLALSSAHAQVASGTTGIDASGSFQQEMQACKGGQTQQDRDTCMREARNAQAERKRGALAKSGVDLQANAVSRCEALEGEYKAACHARIMGLGTTSGSVAGGGVLREVETVVIEPHAGPVTFTPQTEKPVVLVPNKTD